MRLAEYIYHQWYRPTFTPLMRVLRPLSWMFGGVVACRRYFYRQDWLKKVNFPVPVLVVGNLTLGGTGKTPVVIWLSEKLREQGYRPGIVTRGVGRQKMQAVLSAFAHSHPTEVGDEAVVLAGRTGCPVRVCGDRVQAVSALLNETDCNIIISDDGLQHYRLGRTFEMVLVDSLRGFGNGLLLPAGPLREPVSRLSEADIVCVKGEDFTLSGSVLVGVGDERQRRSLSDFLGQTVHAVAGIGHPQQFFADLEAAGLQIIPHILPDHWMFRREDITFTDDLPVVMTEKDAVKCRSFAGSLHWYRPVSVTAGEKMRIVVEKQFSLKG